MTEHQRMFASAFKDDDGTVATLQDIVASMIIMENPDMSWDAICGLDSAKSSLDMATDVPQRFPELFARMRKPINTVLLYGPSGTGKTHLAKAAATASGATFFSIIPSELLSKYVGKPAPLVKEIFTMARASEKGFSIIFIGELDSLCGSDVDDDKRRLLAQLSRDMESMNNKNNSKNDARILVLGETRAPWNLDNSTRKLFKKRIYIGLPDAQTRADMIQVHLGDKTHDLTTTNFSKLGDLTNGASGGDIKAIVDRVLNVSLERYGKASHFTKDKDGDHRPTDTSSTCTECGAKRSTTKDIVHQDLIMTMKDFEFVPWLHPFVVGSAEPVRRMDDVVRRE